MTPTTMLSTLVMASATAATSANALMETPAKMHAYP
jgi:hypothetical protein